MRKRIGLVAHDHCKRDLVEWAEYNVEILIKHDLICTGTTGNLLEIALENKQNSEDKQILKIKKLRSGPLGGDQQMGAMIAEGEIDILIFLCDPMEPQPHDVDVKALLRIASVYNIPMALNRSTADFIISSPLLAGDYKATTKSYSEYLKRSVKL